MFSVTKSPLPDDAFLAEYVREGYYTDCYTTVLPAAVSQADYVTAFYTTCLFKLERLILSYLAGRPSSDQEARALAAGELGKFAAWSVENRSDEQLLMCDFRGKTRSWLMVVPLQSDDGARSRLYFGSAVVPEPNPRTGAMSLGLWFHALAGFHRIYSCALLGAAKSRLKSMRKSL